MSKILLAIIGMLFLLRTGCSKENRSIPVERISIDSIENVNQIMELLSGIDKYSGRMKINEDLKFEDEKCQQLSDSLGVLPWVKEDFDGNGLMDILISSISGGIICVTDMGKGFKISYLFSSSYDRNCMLPVVENKKIALFHYKNTSAVDGGMEQVEKKMIVYRFGGFVEENLAPVSHSIEKIEFSQSACFYNPCPAFDITIDSNGSVLFDAKMNNKIGKEMKNGLLISKISEDKFQVLTHLLDYIEFDRLKEKYASNIIADIPTATIKITYNGGQIKTVEDYGMTGTLGLRRFYELFSDLRLENEWTPIN